MSIHIGNQTISQTDEVYIIAEIGVNHNGSLELAKKMVHVARRAGANAVKFQMFDSKQVVSEDAQLAEYQQKSTYHSQHEMLHHLQLQPKEFKHLKKYCDQMGITFLSTPFDLQSAQILDQLGMEVFKVGSGDVTHFPLLEEIISFQKPIILSTGMSTLAEIEAALHLINDRCPLILLHCTSAYPAPFSDLHLAAIQTLQAAFGQVVGYSDHSLGIEVPIAATALGYKVIEKHMTMDRNMEGPDHSASLEPHEFANMVKAVRNIEQAMGSTKKQVTPSEEGNKQHVRRGIYASQDLRPGHILTENDLLYVRPRTEMEASDFQQVINKQLLVHKQKGQPLHWGELR